MASYGGGGNYQSSGVNQGFFSRILRNVSKWGMDYDDMVIKNAQAVGANETPTPAGQDQTMYDVFSRNAVARLFQDKAISYLDRSYPEKQRILREYSRKDELRDFVTIVADETIMYDEKSEFCFPRSLSEEFDDEIKRKYIENFHHIYNRFQFRDGTLAWEYFRSFLIDGFLAFEIIYDDKHKDIIGFQKLDSTSLLPGIEPNTGDRIWIQYPEAPEYRRILLDSQIIYISYASAAEFSEVSYVEPLIRPYNQLKLLEQTRIMFNVMNAMHFKQFTVPTGGMPRQMAEEQISKLIADYKDEVTWDSEMGIPQINGSPHIPFNKEYWFPEGENGTPSVELIQQQGHDLNDNDMLTWFYNALKRASRIPFTRFDKDNGGGNLFGDITEMTRDEESFFRFISRLRTIYKEIIIKPWRIKMALDFPELREDENFINKIDIEFNGTNLFHEWKKLSNMTKRAEMVSQLSTSVQDSQGNPYFHVEWLVRNILKLTEDEIDENKRYKEQDETPDEGEGEGGMGEPGMGGGADFGGGDMGGGEDMDLGGEGEAGGEEAAGGEEGGGAEGGEEAGGEEGGGEFDF